MASLSLALLGSFRAEYNGSQLTHFRTKTVQALLIYLTCQPEPHSREQLMTLLWPEMSQPSAQKNLRQSLYLLRQAIPEIEAKDEVGRVPFLLADRQTIRVNPNGRFNLDLQQFSNLLNQNEAHWSEAIALYRGDFLADFYLPDSAPFEEWVDARRADLRRQVLTTLETLTAQELAQEHLTQAEKYARLQIDIDNLYESAYQQLIEILARNGRRVDALAQYEMLVQLLQTELAVEPSTETKDLVETIRAENFERGIKKQDDNQLVTISPPHNLPAQPTPLIGREAELIALDGLLATPDIRFITIVGPGGMGKTRLAIACAERQLKAVDPECETDSFLFPDGVFLVKLAAVTNVEHIVPTVAPALGFQLQGRDPQEQQLLNYLHQKKLLLVLDNFEHLLAGVALLSNILAGAPDVSLLVTSRERMKLQVEQLFTIQGLSYHEWQTVAEAEKDEAAQLFLASAGRVLPNFDLKPEYLIAVWRICKLVQGMPLGIILAASWVELLSPTEIAAEIRANLDLLEADYADLPERQRSMRVVFRTTWERLSPTEQTTFSQLSLFRGGFSVDAARAVTSASLRTLMRLSDKSLLVHTGNGRFELHELLRQFAAEELSQLSRKQDAAGQRHALYYCQMLHNLEPDLKGAGIELALVEIENDIENIQTAWNWAVDQEQYTFIHQADFSLARFFTLTSRFEIGLPLFDIAVKRLAEHMASTLAVDPRELLLQARLLAWQCEFLYMLGSMKTAEQRGLEARSLLESTELQGMDVRYERALVLQYLGQVYAWNDYAEATVCLEESKALFGDLGDRWSLVNVIHTMGSVAWRSAEYKLAIKHLVEAQRECETLGDRRLIARTQFWIGNIKSLLGQFSIEEHQIKQSLALFKELGDQRMEGLTYESLGVVAVMRGRFEEACVFYAKGITLYVTLGMKDRLASSNRNWCWGTMLQGKYEMAQARLGRSLDTFQANENKLGIGFCLFVDGSISLVQGKQLTAQRQFQESVTFLRSANQRDELSWVLAVLSCTLTKGGEQAQAARVLNEALQLAQEMHSFISILYNLAATALFLAENGQAVQAIEIYTCVQCYPFVANSRWFDDVIGQPLAEVTASLSSDVVAVAEERGRALDLWATAVSATTQLQGEALS